MNEHVPRPPRYGRPPAPFARRPPPSPRPPAEPRSREPHPDSENWEKPWVQMRYYSFHPCIYKSMLGPASPGAKAGDLVGVYDKEGLPFGTGLYNPKARVPLRVLDHGPTRLGEDLFLARIEQALALRL